MGKKYLRMPTDHVQKLFENIVSKLDHNKIFKLKTTNTTTDTVTHYIDEIEV